MAGDPLLAALRGAGLGRTDGELLASFERPSVRWREIGRRGAGILRRFCRDHEAEVVAATRSAHDQRRHAAVWALGFSASDAAAAPLVALMCRQRDFFDHDFVYDACRHLGAAVVPGLQAVALAGTARQRQFAVECLGHTRAGAVAVAALRDIGKRRGLPPRALAALYNVADPAALPLALDALRLPPKVRIDAMMAVESCVGLAIELRSRLPLPRARVAAAIAAAVADRRYVRADGDPWHSTWAWALEVLARLRDERGRELAFAALDLPADEDRRLEALAALALFEPAPAIEHRAVAQFADRSPAIRAAAALLLLRSRDRARRATARAALLDHVLRHDDADNWVRVVRGLGRRPSFVAEWLDAARGDRSRNGTVRRAVAAALREASSRRGAGVKRRFEREAARLERVVSRSGVRRRR